MAQKYITKFDTLAQYEAHKAELQMPNVSLIKEDGSIKYTTSTYGLVSA